MKAIKNEKNEIVYEYPSVNPYEDRGNQDIGFLEYSMSSKGAVVFLPLPRTDSCENFMEDMQSFWGPNCTLEYIAKSLTRKIGNDWDNRLTGPNGLVPAWENEGKSRQEIVDAMQDDADEYEVNKPRVSTGKADKTAAKEMKSIKTELGINPETGKPFTAEEIIAAAKANLGL